MKPINKPVYDYIVGNNGAVMLIEKETQKSCRLRGAKAHNLLGVLQLAKTLNASEDELQAILSAYHRSLR